MPKLMSLLLSLLLSLLPGAALSAQADCPPEPRSPTASEGTKLAKSAPDRGFLWRIKRDGRTSYLFGSLHIGRAAWLFPGPALRKAWAETDLLALELDLSDAPTLQALNEAGRAREPLSAPLQARMDAQTRAVCLPAQALAALHPLLQVSTLTLLSARWDGLDASFGQEMALTGLAHAQQRRIVALESASEQMQALIPSDPVEAERLVDQALTQLERKEVRRPMLKLAMTWAAGDVEQLQRYEQWCDCVQTEEDRAWLRRINDERNPQLATRIAALHASGQRVLVAVGTLHMSGPQSLTRLLAQQGFVVEPVGGAR